MGTRWDISDDLSCLFVGRNVLLPLQEGRDIENEEEEGGGGGGLCFC